MNINQGFEPYKSLGHQNNLLHQEPFPVDGFPPWIRTFVNEAALSYQVDRGMVGSAVLACLAIALQAKYDVQARRDHIEQLSLHVVIIASSGSRKSPVIRKVFEPAYQYEADLINDIRNRMDVQEQSGSSTPLPTIVIDDCTPEALVIRLEQNLGRVGIVSTEGNLFSVLSGRYSKTSDYNVLAKAYSGDQIRYDRVGRPANYVPHPHVSLCIGMQPHVFRSLVDNASLDGQGILSRWCIAEFQNPSSPREYNVDDISEETSANYKNHMMSLLSLAVPQKPIHLTLSPEAFSLFCTMQNEIDAESIATEQIPGNHAIVSWINKKGGTILRLAGLLHVSNDLLTSEITTAELMAAARLAGWYYENAVRLLSSRNRVISNALNLWKQLRSIRADDNSVAYSQLTHDCCRNKRFLIPETNKLNNDAISDALNILVEHGYVRIETIPTSGRNARVIFLSDDALEASDP